MAERKDYTFAREGNYSFFGEYEGGVTSGIGIGADWNKLSKYVNPLETALLSGGSTYIYDVFTSVEGIPVYLTDGSVATPALAWQNDRDSTLYRLGSANFGWSVSGTLKYDWNSTRMLFASGFNLRISDLTAGNVVFPDSNKQLTGSSSLFWDNANTRLDAKGHMRVGTATDADATGEFSAGLTGSGRMLFHHRFTGDGLPGPDAATVNGDGWLRLFGNAADEYFDFTFHNYGGLIAFKHSARQTTVWGHDGSDYHPILNMRTDSATDHRIQVCNRDDTDFLDLGVDGTGFYIETVTADLLDFGTVGARRLSLTSSAVTYTGSNTSTTPMNQVIQSSTGDAAYRVAIGSTASFAWGIDNSDSDKWKLSYAASGSAVLGTNDFITVLTTGEVGINQGSPARRLEVLAASNQFRITDGTAYVDFWAHSSGAFILTPSGTQVLVTHDGNEDFFLTLRNENNNSSARSYQIISVGGSSAGNPFTRYVVTGVTNWAVGIDNGDSDKFKISTNTDLGTNDRINFETGGNIVINEGGADADLRAEGDNKTACFLLDASDDEVAIDGRFSLIDSTPTQITADQNNYAGAEGTATSRSSVWRISSDAARNITGIANGLQGRKLLLINVGSQNIVIQNENASSTAANRVITGTGADVTLAADDTMELWYDSTSSRWRAL